MSLEIYRLLFSVTTYYYDTSINYSTVLFILLVSEHIDVEPYFTVANSLEEYLMKSSVRLLLPISNSQNNIALWTILVRIR